MRDSPPAGAAPAAGWHGGCLAPGRAVQKTILVVDDDRPSREGLRDVLAHAGYLVETAADSWQAFQRVRERHFAVAIVDLDLPPLHGMGISGWDLARILRAWDPRLAVIVVGAEVDARLRARARLLRLAGTLEKPISPAHLQTIVSGLAD